VKEEYNPIKNKGTLLKIESKTVRAIIKNESTG
jgi:hypothetical protein